MAGVVIAVSQLGHFLLLNDYALFGTAPTFWGLLAARGGFGLLSAVAWLVLSRSPSPAKLDLTLLLWCLTVGGLEVFVAMTRPPGVGVTAMLGVLIVAVFYTFLPLSFSRQLIAGISLSTANIVQAAGLAPASGGISLTSLVVSFAIVNIVGIGVSLERQFWMRLEFKRLLEERRLRADLETALAEVRTLRGLLPVCSHCSKIRNESGIWEKMETYVRKHSEAEFSHGICPECLQTHY